MPDHVFFKANKTSSNLPMIHGHSTIFNQPPQVEIRQIIRSSWWSIGTLYRVTPPRGCRILQESSHPNIAERLIRRRLQSKRSCKVNESSWAMQVTRDPGIPMDPRDMVRPLYIKYTIPFIHYLEEIPPGKLTVRPCQRFGR